MRAIDYWVGIPLVFLLTVVYRLQRLIGLATSPVGRPRNILFIQLAEMGTMVVAYPSLRKARELYPDATLHFLCFTQIRPSVEILEIIPSENIVTITFDARTSLGLVRLRAREAIDALLPLLSESPNSPVGGTGSNGDSGAPAETFAGHVRDRN